MSETLHLTIEFGGGTELLTATPKVKVHRIELPSHVSSAPAVGPQATVTAPSFGSTAQASESDAQADLQQVEQERPTDIKYVLQWIRANLIVERHEMLLDGDGVRAGILVLINDADWELEGEEGYVIKGGDRLTFISTLHGG